MSRLTTFIFAFLLRRHRSNLKITAAAAVGTMGSGRTLDSIEQTWCRVVAGGTGTTVLALQMAKTPSKYPLPHEMLQKLRHSHPILRSKLHYNCATKEFSLLTPAEAPPLTVIFHDAAATAHLLRRLSNKQTSDLSPCHIIMEHELNDKTWRDPSSFPCGGADVLLAAVYALSETRSLVVLRLHAAACDRTTVESVLRELMELVVEAGGGAQAPPTSNVGEGETGIEGLVPRGAGKKTLWAHGIDMLGYSLSSLRLTNLRFKNTKVGSGGRCSEVVRLKLDTRQTAAILSVHVQI